MQACVTPAHRSRKPRRPAAFAALLVLTGAAVRADRDFPRGTVIEKVPCLNDAGQSYALYLPSAYSPERKWPIVYALDAGARGKLPVTRFSSAAEEFGYILAGSNNSRNGPVQVIETAIRSMLSDTQARFSVDPDRVYFAGFSGGARVAVAVASTLPGRAAGVIACGAGFPRTIEPSASTRFAFLGAAGIEDFNAPELRRLDRRLDDLGLPHRLELFDGGHEWPPQAVCSRAIEWMELQAIRSGVRQGDPRIKATLFERMCEDARSHGAAGRYYEEFQAWSAVARDFAGLSDLTEVSRRQTELGDSKQFRDSAARLSRIDGIQQRSEETFHRLTERVLSGDPNDPFAALRLRTFVSDVLRDSRSAGREEQRIAARRMAAFCWVELNEAVGSDFEAQDYRRAALRLELLADLKPEDYRVRFHLARARALMGDKRKALEELGRAVDLGFGDLGLLESNPEFEALRDESGFRAILGRIRK